MSVIQAGNTTTTSLIYTGDTTGNLVFTTGGSNTVALTIDSTQNITTTQKFASVSMPTGSILQVVNVTYGTLVSSTSATFANSGLAASITPKFSTSKILIIVDANGVSGYTSSSCVGLRIARGSTAILTYETIAAFLSGGLYNMASGTSSATYLDSPATTSSTTYNLQIARTQGAGTAYINNYSNINEVFSTMTLMEIAA